MNRCLCLLMIVLLSVALGAVGDTIINVWGTLDYGWIDANTFGMRFRGSEQTCQVEQDWPKSILLITNYARRLKENLFAWQVRKSRDGEILQVITNDFTRRRSYSSDSSAPQAGSAAPYSEFQSVSPRIFDDTKMFAEGDQIEFRLCWFTEVSIFSFTVPSPPFALPAANNESKSQGNEPPVHDQSPGIDGKAANPSTPPSAGVEHAPEVNESTSEDQGSDKGASEPASIDVPAVQQESPESAVPASEDKAPVTEDTTQSTEVMPPPEAEPVTDSQEQPMDSARAEEPPAPFDEVALQSSYVQGDTIHYSFPAPTLTSNSASLAVVEVKAGAELDLVYYGDIAYDSATGMFAIDLDTTDFPIGSYELVIWIAGEMGPRRKQFDVVLPQKTN